MTNVYKGELVVGITDSKQHNTQMLLMGARITRSLNLNMFAIYTAQAIRKIPFLPEPVKKDFFILLLLLQVSL